MDQVTKIRKYLKREQWSAHFRLPVQRDDSYRMV